MADDSAHDGPPAVAIPSGHLGHSSTSERGTARLRAMSETLHAVVPSGSVDCEVEPEGYDDEYYQDAEGYDQAMPLMDANANDPPHAGYQPYCSSAAVLSSDDVDFDQDDFDTEILNTTPLKNVIHTHVQGIHVILQQFDSLFLQHYFCSIRGERGPL